jgi:internalin A
MPKWQDKSKGWQEASRRIKEARRTNSPFLDLKGLALSVIPDALAQLANLQHLDLSGNHIAAIPDSLAQLVNLRNLDLSKNQITAIPESLGQLANLRHLELGHNQFTGIPNSLAQLASLEHLDLKNNQITAIPDSLAQLAKLQILYLKNNQITAIPDSLAQLAKLYLLHLGNNKIAAIPDSVGQLAHLGHLDLSKNKITAIPDSLAQLAKLQILFLENNKITAIPDSLAQLAKLQILDLENNKITAIPDSLAQLAKLQILDLENNKITAIPDFLAQLANLKTLTLSGNPLPEELLAALKQGIPTFFRYLESTAKSKVYPRTVKLVLLGEPKSGKTTLLEALQGNPLPCEESRQETLGVNVVTIEKAHPTDHQPMYLSAWDFAGQHIEHATHQFFLTENAIYLILWNARQGAASGKHDLWYWLELLKMRVREPKFLLVATHTEHTPPDLNLADIESSYSGCQGHFPVELSTLKGVSSLEAKILELAAASPSMRAPWPPEWRDVRDEVRKVRKQQPYMTPETFTAFMKTNGVTGEEAQRDLAGQLHHLGEILYFQERDELSSLVILNPEWVTELIALVLRSQQVREHSGILRKADLDQLWDKADLKPEVRDHLIHLMDWFDLTYSTGHTTDLGIVVEALPYSKPEDLKQIELPPDEPQMEMIFRFPSLQRRLPPGIPTWGIARAHRYSSQHTPWRDAARFEDNNTKSHALILASDTRKEVRLRVAADYPPFFFGQLQAILLDTFKRYPGAVPELRFPCPCRPGCTTSYLYETVVKRWRDHKDVYCDLSAEDVSVESLLSGAQRRPETPEGRLALLSEIRRQFTAQRHAQNQQMEKNCPSVFTLVPSRDFKQLDTWLESVTQGEELELAVYCEHDSGWHPTAHSLYRFKPDQEWFDLVKKSWNKLAAVTRYVGPLAKAIGKASKLVALEVGAMAAEKLPEVSRSIAGPLSAELRGKDEPESIDIEVRHLLERLINFLDSKRPPLEPNNGGLHRHIIDDGRLLWLCPEHKKLYQPRA